jgi:gamma-glutamyl-gamma-aminobutyrate hydrolase PuuD
MRVGLTQRVEDLPGIGERRDCLDQRWSLLLEDIGAAAIPLPNLHRVDAAYLDRIGIDAVILTGGNDIATLPGSTKPAPERDAFEKGLLDYCAARRLPVLGICRGMQFMQHVSGGPLVRVEGHVATEHRLIWAPAPPLDPAPEVVNSYHDYALPRSGLAADFNELAWTEDGTVEAFRHKTLPWIGIMWHPERETNPNLAVRQWMARHLGKSGT